MRGDPSDNLPGVPGVGEKTAAKLINDYGDLDGIFANVDKCTPKLRSNLSAAEDQVRQNESVMILRRDVELDVELDDLARQPFDAEAVRNLFNFLEFRTLYDRLVEAIGDEQELPAGESVDRLECGVVRIENAADAVALFGRLGKDRTTSLAVAPAWTGSAGRSAFAGVAFVTSVDPGEAAWVPGDLINEPKVLDGLRSLVAEGG